jgi:long-chain acyl-CoA synthetase
LEIIYDSNSGHQKAEYTIIVLGEPTAQMMASVASNIKVYTFDELEREGVKREKLLSPIPSASLFSTNLFNVPT